MSASPFTKVTSVAIVGASGSGKTTLILVMCGIRVPTTGRFAGRAIPSRRCEPWTDLRRSEIGIVFQEFNLFPTLTASENVEVAMFGSSASTSERRRRVEEALETVGLADRATHLPHELSGGERQRVAIARSIINNPALILADEPTGNLDSANASAIFDLLFDLQRARGATLVMVSHEPSLRRALHAADQDEGRQCLRPAVGASRPEGGDMNHLHLPSAICRRRPTRSVLTALGVAVRRRQLHHAVWPVAQRQENVQQAFEERGTDLTVRRRGIAEPFGGTMPQTDHPGDRQDSRGRRRVRPTAQLCGHR